MEPFLAVVAVGCRRYLPVAPGRRLLWYYAAPIVPLLVLLASHIQFLYGGGNYNWVQLFVASFMIPIMAFFLWLSALADESGFPADIECLRRQRYRLYPGPIERAPLLDALGTRERRVALIGDSLSTNFHVASQPTMILQMWRAWKTNWFLGDIYGKEPNPGVAGRLSELGLIVAVQHASASARVDSGYRRDFFDYLTDTWHFSHQVDEILSGPFPDLVLIWIGHNDVDWATAVSTLTPEHENELADAFARRYEVQLRRLIRGALARRTSTAVVVFGLVNFASFFEARTKAEGIKRKDKRSFPRLHDGYRYFISMKPQYRPGMVTLALAIDKKLIELCNRLSGQISRTRTRLVYSDAMSTMEFADPDLLSTVDAWHASDKGHLALTNVAYPTAFEQARFLGWNRVVRISTLGRSDEATIPE